MPQGSAPQPCAQEEGLAPPAAASTSAPRAASTPQPQETAVPGACPTAQECTCRCCNRQCTPIPSLLGQAPFLGCQEDPSDCQHLPLSHRQPQWRPGCQAHTRRRLKALNLGDTIPMLNLDVAAYTGSCLASVCTQCSLLLPAPGAACPQARLGLAVPPASHRCPGAPCLAQSLEHRLGQGPYGAEHGTAPAACPAHPDWPWPQLQACLPAALECCPISPLPHATNVRTTNQTQSRTLGNSFMFPTSSRRAQSPVHSTSLASCPNPTRLLAAPMLPRGLGGAQAPARASAPRCGGGHPPGQPCKRRAAVPILPAAAEPGLLPLPAVLCSEQCPACGVYAQAASSSLCTALPQQFASEIYPRTQD